MIEIVLTHPDAFMRRLKLHHHSSMAPHTFMARSGQDSMRELRRCYYSSNWVSGFNESFLKEAIRHAYLYPSGEPVGCELVDIDYLHGKYKIVVVKREL